MADESTDAGTSGAEERFRPARPGDFLLSHRAPGSAPAEIDLIVNFSRTVSMPDEPAR
jgi:hypothetical protein